MLETPYIVPNLECTSSNNKHKRRVHDEDDVVPDTAYNPSIDEIVHDLSMGEHMETPPKLLQILESTTEINLQHDIIKGRNCSEEELTQEGKIRNTGKIRKVIQHETQQPPNQPPQPPQENQPTQEPREPQQLPQSQANNTKQRTRDREWASPSKLTPVYKNGGVSILESLLVMKDYVPPHQITNVVCTFRLGLNYVDLVKLSQEHDFITYNPSKFAAGTIRNREPKTSFLLFRTGAAVCTGARTVEEARYGARLLCNYFMAKGHQFVMTDFRVRNVVGTMWCPFKLNLLPMYKRHMVEENIKSSFNPELFTGLIIRIGEPKSVSLVFDTGKVVCTGARSQKEIECAFEYTYTKIFKHFVTRTGDEEFVDQYPKFPGQKGADTSGGIIRPAEARKMLEHERTKAGLGKYRSARKTTPENLEKLQRIILNSELEEVVPT